MSELEFISKSVEGIFEMTQLQINKRWTADLFSYNKRTTLLSIITRLNFIKFWTISRHDTMKQLLLKYYYWLLSRQLLLEVFIVQKQRVFRKSSIKAIELAVSEMSKASLLSDTEMHTTSKQQEAMDAGISHTILLAHIKPYVMEDTATVKQIIGKTVLDQENHY